MKGKNLRDRMKETERIDILEIELMNHYKLTNKDGTNFNDNEEHKLIIAWSEEHAKFIIDNYWRINVEDIIIEKEERL
jgi:hypothetical protein